MQNPWNELSLRFCHMLGNTRTVPNCRCVIWLPYGKNRYIFECAGGAGRFDSTIPHNFCLSGFRTCFGTVVCVCCFARGIYGWWNLYGFFGCVKILVDCSSMLSWSDVILFATILAQVSKTERQYKLRSLYNLADGEHAPGFQTRARSCNTAHRSFAWP